jgi:hypothetical protein
LTINTNNETYVRQNDVPLGRDLRLSHGVNKHLLYISLAPSLGAEGDSTLPRQAALSYITSIPEEQAVLLVVPACPIIVVSQWLFENVAHITGTYSG